MAYRLLNRIHNTAAGSLISSETNAASLRAAGGVLVNESAYWAAAFSDAKALATLRTEPDAVERALTRKFLATLVGGTGGANELQPTEGGELVDMLAFACRTDSTQRTIRLAFGTDYTIDEPLFMATPGAQCWGVSILGSSPVVPGLSTNSRILCNFDDGPAVAMQGVRACEVGYVEIVGQASYKGTFAAMADMLNESWFNVGSARDNRYSPHCAIALDPVHDEDAHGWPGASEANAYQALLARYTDQHHIASLAGNYITNVACTDFPAGIVNSPGGVLLGGDNWLMQYCYFNGCRVGVATCQGQTKSNILRDCHWNYALDCINTRKYGSQTGFAPIVDRGDAGVNRRFVNLVTNWSPFIASGLFIEAMLQLGIAGFSLTSTREFASWRDCVFDIYELTTSRSVDVHYINHMPTKFDGCRLANNDGGSNVLRCHNMSGTPIIFDFCKIDYIDWAGRGPAISFHDDSAVNLRTSGFLHSVDGTYYKNDQPLDTSTDTVLGSVTITSTGTHTATFTLAAHGRARGDIIYATNLGESYVPEEIPGNLTNCPIGVVHSVSGDDVTLHRIPKSFTLPATLSVTAKRYASS